MPFVEGYAPTHDRPPFLEGGVVVARRAGLRFSRPEPYAVGEVLPADELTPRLVVVLWRNAMVDTLPAESIAPPPPPAKPQPKAAPPRGR